MTRQELSEAVTAYKTQQQETLGELWDAISAAKKLKLAKEEKIQKLFSGAGILDKIKDLIGE